MKFIEKLKKIYAYHKTPCKEEAPPERSDLKIRSVYFAFLTVPYPVLPSEKETQRKKESLCS